MLQAKIGTIVKLDMQATVFRNPYAATLMCGFQAGMDAPVDW